MKIATSYLLTILIALFAFSCSDDDDDDNPNINNPTNQSNFCYELSTSRTAYDTISGGNEFKEIGFGEKETIPLDFPFSFCGTTFREIHVGSSFTPTFTFVDNNGFVDVRNYELVFNLSLNFDMAEKYEFNNSNGLFESVSPIRYKTTGSPGSRKLSIEYRNYSFESFDTSYTFTTKVNIFEGSNKIEYHYGPHDVTAKFQGTFNSNTVGLYAIEGEDALFLSGDPSSPSVKKNPTNAFGVPLTISSWPPEGTKYTFTLK